MKANRRKRRVMAKVTWMAAVVLLAGLLGGCASPDTENRKDSKENGLKVICTGFSLYDWTMQIVGDENDAVKVTYLLSNGTDMHSFQPGAKEVAEISSCDVLVYVGGESEKWIDEILANAPDSERKVVRLLDVLEEKLHEEELAEGMQEGHGTEEHSHEETEYDEHVWLSIKNAEKSCEAVKKALCEKDAVNASLYEENYEKYLGELHELDSQYETMMQSAQRKTILFGDRFPFRYLTEDYGIQYYAAFPGCSAETEASFETVAFLAGKMDEENLPAILILENSDDRIAKTILSNTRNSNREILVMNSLQSVNAKEIEKGISYDSVMKENLETLKKALNGVSP